MKVIDERDIPLILCSSKTKSEIEFYRRRLGNEHPFISENGGGIFVPVGYWNFQLQYDSIQNGYWAIHLGTENPSLTKALDEVRAKTGLKIKSFSEMSDAEIANLAGLRLEEARLARERQFSEPFLIEGKTNGLTEAVTALGLQLTEGRRFLHLMGKVDKGKATQRLTEIYRENRPDYDIVTVSIGDSLNDLPMLKAADIAVLVKGPEGRHDPRVAVEGLIRTKAIGPKGWNEAVLELLT